MYGRWQFNLLTVKPGITGPWQVQGRCNLSYEDRVALSMYYIRNYSIWADLDILLRTVPVVLNGSGAY
jgi:lipopolysaccharide/colanic/teichoic acid biosynthesis glycosyltransferase